MLIFSSVARYSPSVRHGPADAQAGRNAIPLTQKLVKNTTYYATQTVSGCESSAFAVTVSLITGIETMDEQLKLHPNPVRGLLTISHSSDIVSIVVTNYIGQNVIIRNIRSTACEIDMSVLDAGVYSVKVTLKNKVILRRVIKL